MGEDTGLYKRVGRSLKPPQTLKQRTLEEFFETKENSGSSEEALVNTRQLRVITLNTRSLRDKDK